MTMETTRDGMVTTLSTLGGCAVPMRDIMKLANDEKSVIIYGYAIRQTLKAIDDDLCKSCKELDPDGSKLTSMIESKSIIAESFFDAITRLRN